jgi:hypothetical protein
MSDDPLQDPNFQLTLDVPLHDRSPSPSSRVEDKKPAVAIAESVSRLPQSVVVLSSATVDGHTLYTIAVTWDQHSTWTVAKRFSEIDDLHQALNYKVANLPNLPPKKMIFNMDPQFVNQRKTDIDNYLKELFKIEHITIFPELQAFFKFKERGIRIRPLGSTVPYIVCKFKDPQFGFNSVWFDQSLGIGVSISENGNAISRVDKIILNVKLPWEEKSMIVISSFEY